MAVLADSDGGPPFLARRLVPFPDLGPSFGPLFEGLLSRTVPPGLDAAAAAAAAINITERVRVRARNRKEKKVVGMPLDGFAGPRAVGPWLARTLPVTSREGTPSPGLCFAGEAEEGRRIDGWMDGWMELVVLLLVGCLYRICMCCMYGRERDRVKKKKVATGGGCGLSQHTRGTVQGVRAAHGVDGRQGTATAAILARRSSSPPRMPSQLARSSLSSARPGGDGPGRAGQGRAGQGSKRPAAGGGPSGASGHSARMRRRHQGVPAAPVAVAAASRLQIQGCAAAPAGARLQTAHQGTVLPVLADNIGHWTRTQQLKANKVEGRWLAGFQGSPRGGTGPGSPLSDGGGLGSSHAPAANYRAADGMDGGWQPLSSCSTPSLPLSA
ncbi:hypothetical protein CDD83_5610 [Cordyceps sp. RAO-2017]|nr:hypothetical protein CDD83_5610 [Cordyceps sp. RAO-2017]